MISQLKNIYRRYIDRQLSPAEFRQFRDGLDSIQDDDLWSVMLNTDSEGETDVVMPTGIKHDVLQHLRRMILRRRVWIVTRYAAAVILAAGAGLGLLALWNTPAPSHLIAASVAAGSKSEIVLPDGTKVQLNGASSVKCDLESRDCRTVSLQGEAFFDVAKDPDRPFRVQVADMQIEVRGTSFNVNAYDPDVVETSLITGKVTISGRNIPGEYHLEKGDKAVYRRSDGSVSIDKADLHLATGWLDEYLIFDSEPLEDVIRKVERWYGVEIEMRCATTGDDRLSGSFRHENIHNVMESLSIQYKFSYEIDKDRIIIY